MQLPGLTVGIIADDLTGACDTALQFFHAGCQTRVLLEPDKLPASSDEENQVWSISTESRHIEPRNAIAKVREAIELLKDHYGAEHFYKKMDSTLRGHFTEECLAAVDELGWDCVVVAPAYPQEGRRTVGGYQLVHGIPIEQTEVSQDPRFPACQSHIPTVMAEASKSDIVAHIELATVLRGAGPLLAELTELIAEGKKLVVVDACSNTDLEQIALVIEKVQKTAKVLPCGSAGLAQALSKHWPNISLEPLPETEKKLFSPSPILIGSGTNTALTRTQILQLMDNYLYYGEGSELLVVDIDPEHILGLSPLEPVIEHIVDALGDSNTVVVSTSAKEESLPRTLELAEENGLTEEEVTSRAQTILSQILETVLQEKPAKIILTGGDTATHTCHRLGYNHLIIAAEIEPSIPLLRNISSESTSGHQWLVTKSGNFGSNLALANIVRYLKQHEISSAKLSG